MILKVEPSEILAAISLSASPTIALPLISRILLFRNAEVSTREPKTERPAAMGVKGSTDRTRGLQPPAPSGRTEIAPPQLSYSSFPSTSAMTRWKVMERV